MSLPDEILAIRQGVALNRLDHLRYLRIRGDGAWEALDHLCPADLRLRDGQVLQGLLLDDDGHPFADICLGCDDVEFFMLVEGPSRDALAEHLGRHLAGLEGVEWRDQTDERAILGLDGPYAWELLGEVLGPDAVGLPYLTFYHLDDATCCRVGKTGEYGYMLVTPRDAATALATRLVEAGRAFEVAQAGLDALDQCALENWYFNIRREGREPLTPIELQLQWRVSYKKSYVGSEALQRRRREGPRQRLTCLVSDGPMDVGAAVSLDGADVGRIVNSGHSVSREEWVALGLIDVAWAHPGISSFRVIGDDGPAPARSVSPPVLHNRSLYVRPQIHSFATRHEFAFPSLRRG